MNTEIQDLATVRDGPAPRRERGDGSIFRRPYRDKKTGALKKTAMLYMKFYVGGKPVVEPTGTTKPSEAKKALRQRLGEIACGRYVPAEATRTTFGQIRTMAIDHYKANGRKSLERFEDAAAHLTAFFTSDIAARHITADRVTAYVASRREEKAANATINRELAALKLMFRLAERAGKVQGRPYIAMLAENNVRKGFFEEDQFEAVHARLPEALKPVFTTAYITGWRVKSEILTRQKSHLDLKAGWLRLEPGETKNGKGRMFPLVPRLRAVFEQQAQATRAIEQGTGTIIPFLFHRQGRPIRSFRRAWISACKAAGVPERLPHDFRRTAIRNLERSGVPRSAAMAMVGHQTEAVYRRYAIVEEKMLNEAGVKLQSLYDSGSAKPSGKVVAIRKRGAARAARAL